MDNSITSLPGWYLPVAAAHPRGYLSWVKKMLPPQPECDLSQLLQVQMENFCFVQDSISLREYGPGVAPLWVGIIYQGWFGRNNDNNPRKGSALIATAYPLKLCLSEPNIGRFRTYEQKKILLGLEKVIEMYTR
ncbi:hypothetical protein HYV86_02110 [Candidatus Woesearchaeota archaeon]|nr:hypothetical protein [Candidatus Woesearchaeota archaeon]